MRRESGRGNDRRFSSWSGRRILSWTLFGLALLVAGQHLLAHGGWQPIPIGMGKQDLFIGYPMALILGIAGAFALDPNPHL